MAVVLLHMDAFISVLCALVVVVIFLFFYTTWKSVVFSKNFLFLVGILFFCLSISFYVGFRFFYKPKIYITDLENQKTQVFKAPKSFDFEKVTALKIPQIFVDSQETQKALQFYFLAHKNMKDGFLEKAHALFSESLKLIKKEQESDFFAQVLLKLGDLQISFGKIQESKAHYEEAFKLFNHPREDKYGQIEALVGLGKTEVYFGNFDAALEFLERAQSICEVLQDMPLMGYVLCNQAQILMEIGDLQKAKEVYKTSYEICVGCCYQDCEATSLLGLGNIEKNFGNIGVARQHYMKALSVFKEIGSIEGEAKALCMLGFLELDMDHNDQAFIIFQQAEVLFKKINSLPGFAQVFSNQARVYESKGDVEKARSLYEKSIFLNKQGGNKFEEARSYFSIAVFETSIGHCDRAEIAFKECLNLLNNKQLTLLLCDVYREIGNLERHKSNTAEAKNAYLRSVEIAKSIRHNPKQSDALQHLATAELYVNDHHSAEKNYQKAIVLAENHQILRGNCFYGLCIIKHLVGEYEESIKYSNDALKEYKSINYTHGKAKVYYMKGVIEISRNNYNEAYDDINIALGIFDQLNDIEYRSKCHIERGRIDFIRGKNNAARQDFQEGFVLSKQAGQKWMAGYALLCIGKVDFAEAHMEESKKSFEEAISILTSINERTEKINALNGIAELYIHIGDVKNAKKTLDYAVSLSREANYPIGLCQAYVNLGILNYNQANYKMSAHFFQEAYELAHKIKHSRLIVFSQIGLGLLKESDGNSNEAKRLFQLSYEQIKGVGDVVLEGITLEFIALNHLYVEEYTQAFNCCEQALILFQNCNNVVYTAFTKRIIGKIYWFKNAYQEALESFRGALALAETTGNLREIAENCLALGQVILKFSNTKEAKIYFDKALQIYRELDDKAGIAETLRWQGELNKLSGSFEIAYKNYQEALRIFHEVGCTVKILSTTQGLASLIWRQGNLSKAQKKLEQIYEKAKDLNQRFIIQVAYDLGKLSLVNNDRQKALSYFKEAMFKSKELNIYSSYYAISAARYFYTVGLDDYASGISGLKQLLQEVISDNNSLTTSFVLKQMGILASLKKDFSQADALLSRAGQLLEEVDFKLPKLKLYIAMAQHLYRKGDIEKMKDYYGKALMISREMNDEYHEGLVYLFFGKNLEKTEKAKSLDYLEKASEIFKRLHVTFSSHSL